tara:strand:+ start:334 stop:540 length:207 start_codon:yes stop_codon:yes gene_type:complete
MNITKAKYRNNTIVEGIEITNIVATIDGQEMSVPLDSANRHYQAIQEWVKEGNKIEDADPVEFAVEFD